MKTRASLLRRLAFALVARAGKKLPIQRSAWAEVMKNEVQHIDGDLQALRWAAGCVLAGYLERAQERPSSFSVLIRHPSAFVPLAMSLTALAVVLGYLAMFGVVRQKDEGAAAHIWQLLMAGQLPVLAFFAAKWLPRSPRQALYVLALQAMAVLAAMAPVFFLKL